MSELPADLRRHGARWQAPYATDPLKSRGRVHDEPGSPTRSPFQRDRDRIIHSSAFRRLKHKTQVFVRHDDDHYRTRLTHTLEVAQIARSIARPLGLDEDLAEALALAHDLGHPPFGHAGEAALDQAMSAHGGFDHNVQSLRVVTKLERRYALFDGLNLTFETLEGLAKHNGPVVPEPGDGDATGTEGTSAGLRAYAERDLELHLYPGLEAQVAAISDDIAYDSHDIEDGLRAGLIGLGDVDEVPLTRGILRDVDAEHPGLDRSRAVHELIRRLITRMIDDVLVETAGRIVASAAGSVEDVRRAGRPLCGFSTSMAAAEGELKDFLFRKLYRCPAVTGPAEQARSVVCDLFETYSSEPRSLPDAFQEGLDMSDPADVPRHVADHVAGMSELTAVAEHRRLFDATPDLG